MVRRVRLGRRTASERARTWAGPPPLLVLATLVGFGVVPFLDHSTSPPQPRAVVVAGDVRSPRSVEQHVALPPAALPPGQGGHLTSGLRPVTLKPVDVGVATMNMYRKLAPADAAADARRLTRHPGVDVVGWQEANRFGAVLHALPGWDTKTFPFGKRNSELAVSWRSSEFTLVSARQRQVARGISSLEGRYPFGNRLVATVTLKHRETGRLLTVIDVHLPQAIEDLDRPGHWRDTINAFRARNQLQRIAAAWHGAPGRWVVGTGDYNFDVRADARHRPAGGPRRALAGTAVSSYQALGTDVQPTHWPTDRRIDYVWVDRAALTEGEIRFRGQWVLGGFHSDHRPLFTKLVLS
ncbi:MULTISPECIES: endonuclease/exonuclease/phosphatase family protein [unclassified Nocardioides]|uniref:endonuclease/exonuclease/phosphatase family protein n=1 Tax=unclassified Nocardioides TaxID=2615069 RepID=UPI0009F07136|nr:MULTISPECIES: endonuclease/exonuclease/phosphatase family protein [unclassified Nocardioides]GAW48760.1 endonuclease/exonuclease/phosphatase [Nocardioides sp. PD653-B2]GAW54397.1 endonuclease/exonuclease/phosphatase [Nocardioides sp. PD653]